MNNVEIVAFVSAIGEISMNKSPQDAKFQELLNTITREQVDGVGPIRCPDANVREEMVKVIENIVMLKIPLVVLSLVLSEIVQLD